MFSLSEFLGVEKKNRSLVYIIYYIYLVSGMLANVLGSILSYFHDEVYGYGFSASFQGTLSSINQVGSFLALFVAGYLPFAIGRKNSSVLLISAEAIGFLAMALTGNPYLLIAAFVLCGLGRGTVSNVTNVVIGEYAENKVAGMNILHATFAIGAVLSPVLMALVGPARWRTPVIVISLLIMSAVVLLAFSTMGNEPGAKDNEEMTVPRSLNFWMNTIMLFFYLCVESSLMSYLVSYFHYNGIFSDAASNMMASILWLAILGGRLTCAFFSSKVNKKVLVLVLGLSLLFFFTLFLGTTNPIVAVVATIGIGLSLSGIYPTVMASHEDKYSRSTSATAICIGTTTVGAILMPMIVGLVSNRHGYHTGLVSLYVPLLLMVTLMGLKFLLKEKTK